VYLARCSENNPFVWDPKEQSISNQQYTISVFSCVRVQIRADFTKPHCPKLIFTCVEPPLQQPISTLVEKTMNETSKTKNQKDDDNYQTEQKRLQTKTISVTTTNNNNNNNNNVVSVKKRKKMEGVESSSDTKNDIKKPKTSKQQ
jgi:hypothetical protein